MDTQATKEFRRITRQAEYRTLNADFEVEMIMLPTTNDYIKDKGNYFEYVSVWNENAFSWNIFKLTGEKLAKIKKAWKDGEVVEKLRGQKLI